jgi:D-sedoheptulose 7-phosphate isomerase
MYMRDVRRSFTGIGGCLLSAIILEMLIMNNAPCHTECWNGYVQNLTDVLTGLEATDFGGTILEHPDAFIRWTILTAKAREKGAVYLIGNGASAAMASHFAADLAKNAGIPAYVFTDPALITAMSNDIGYEECFAAPLRRHIQPGSMLLAISSSGNSPNIINGCRAARTMGGHIVTLSAMKPDNAVRSLGDLNLYIAASTYSLAESGHAAVLHHWLDRATAMREKDIVT